ncbi:MAG: dihydroorotase [Bacteroidales bacterium]|jgi:dihydroorotase|nr:dihydroorotase [Bacteroidales bacterium]
METCNNYFIYNAFVVNEGKIFCADVLIQGGKIVRIMKKDALVEDLFLEEDTVFIDATNKYLLPGVIDEHVHFREPGLTPKGDMYSESRAAVAGGVTSVMDMPNVFPQTITNELLDEKYHLAKDKMFTNYSFYLGATNHNIAQIRQADRSRICGVKLFMGSSTGDMLVSDDEILHELFQIQTLPIAVHCEDETIIANNIQQAKKCYGEHVPIEAHAKIRSEAACFVSTQKAVALAQQYGTKLHILHLSTAKELTLLTNQYPNISAEVCTAYLYLDESDYLTLGTKMKCNPSIKQSSDKAALFAALLSGRIATIASDHAPHTREEKENTYFQTPSGIPIVQHSLLLMLELYKENKIKLQTIVNCMSHAPARIYAIEQRGFIREGYFADLVLADMEQETEINTDTIYYKCKWSPFEGKKIHARIDKTFVNGELVYNDGIFAASPCGQALQFKR